MQVQFKEFALDFDNFVVPQEALPQAEGELLRSMQHLRLAAQVPYLLLRACADTTDLLLTT